MYESMLLRLNPRCEIEDWRNASCSLLSPVLISSTSLAPSLPRAERGILASSNKTLRHVHSPHSQMGHLVDYY